MNKIGTIVLLIIIGSIVGGYFVIGEVSSANSNKSMNSEASKVATDYWNSLFIICSGDYYVAHTYKSHSYGDSGVLRYKIWQYRGVKYKTTDRSERLSGADKLNGFEYEGRTKVDCKFERVFLSRTDSWTDWKNCVSKNGSDVPILGFRFYKKDGVWVYPKVIILHGSDKYRPVPTGKALLKENKVGSLTPLASLHLRTPYTLDLASYINLECSDIPNNLDQWMNQLKR